MSSEYRAGTAVRFGLKDDILIVYQVVSKLCNEKEKDFLLTLRASKSLEAGTCLLEIENGRHLDERD